MTEVLVVVAIIAILVGFAIVGFRNYAAFQQFNQAVSEVTFALNQTRMNARAAEQDESHGVKFTTTGLTQFVGSTYVAGAPQNVTTTYQLVTLQYDLTDAADVIVFNKLTGLPSATGTVIVEGTDFNASTTITITETGVIQ